MSWLAHPKISINNITKYLLTKILEIMEFNTALKKSLNTSLSKMIKAAK